MLNLSIISGRIVDDGGRPVRNAIVGAAGGHDTSVGRTNDRGLFSLGLSAAEPVRLLARKPGFVLGVVRGVAPWTLDLELVLQRGAEIAGRILATPAPKRLHIHLNRWNLGRWSRVTAGSVRLEPDGRFSITRIPSGLYELSLAADKRGASDPMVLDLSPGQVVGGLEIELPKA